MISRSLRRKGKQRPLKQPELEPPTHARAGEVVYAERRQKVMPGFYLVELVVGPPRKKAE